MAYLRGHEVPLFTFANHGPNWLDEVASKTFDEPWGKDNKILEIYLRANFEIARQQGKVYENESQNLAFWRPGFLVNPIMTPIWMVYEKNDPRYKQKWNFCDVVEGDTPATGITGKDYSLTYEYPEFNPEWDIYIDTQNQKHFIEANNDRLVSVLGKEAASNEFRAFRTIYGEIMLERKNAANIIPQWYNHTYNFLMPLYLTQSDKIDLFAALTIEEAKCRYHLRTLLYPHYAYANARAVVKSRSQFALFSLLKASDLDNASYADKNEDSEE